MLVAIGISFAMWDNMSVVKATTGYVSYSSAQVGDVIQYGRYYQTGVIGEDGEYEKTPIDWIVVDKDERTGQITLLSKYILASGSFFGNNYFNAEGYWGAYYSSHKELNGLSYNQAYIDSTVRAYLNNLERMDLGGDGFVSGVGYVPSMYSSDTATGKLRSSVGFSNQRYFTGLNYTTPEDKQLVDNGTSGLTKRFEANSNEIFYQRPIGNDEYKARPACRGFYDEAFNSGEKELIVPKVIGGYVGARWPESKHSVSYKSYIEGALDKVWLPSVTELNVANGTDWTLNTDDAWTSSSDKSSATVFEYFKNYSQYKNPLKTGDGNNQSVAEAIDTKRTDFAKNSYAANFSIPLYKYQTTEINVDINSSRNSCDHYWTRSPISYWSSDIRIIKNGGLFSPGTSHDSYYGVRPCIILKY